MTYTAVSIQRIKFGRNSTCDSAALNWIKFDTAQNATYEPGLIDNGKLANQIARIAAIVVKSRFVLARKNFGVTGAL